MIDAVQAFSVILILGITVIIAKLIAPYIARVYNRTPSRLDKVVTPVENFIYKICSIDPAHSMGWKQYFLTGFLLNIAQMIIAFLILVFQGGLPLNPLGFPGLSWDLALHTVISFATNTNLQHYNGEATLSIFSQMTAIQFLQWTSAATGICVGIAFVRGFIVGSKNMGNFYVDFVRTITRILLPLCLVASIVFVVMGVPQTLNASTTVTTVQGTTQSILVGPVASVDSIMQLGTNGGGF